MESILTHSRLSLLALGLGLLSLYSANTILGTLIPTIAKQYSLSALEEGAIVSGYGYTYAAMQIPVGYICDRYEPKKIITISLLALTGSCLFFSLSVDFFQLLTSRLVMGIAGSFLFVDGLKAIEMGFGRSSRGISMGIYVGFAYSGIPLSNLFAQYSLQVLKASWQSIYEGATLLVVFALILSALVLPSVILNRKSRDNGKPPEFSNYFHELRVVIGNVHFLIQTAISFIAFGSVFALIYWLPSYTAVQGLGTLVGSISVALIGVGSAIGSIFGGILADRFRRRLPIIRASLLIYAAFLSLITLVFISMESGIWIIASCFVIGLMQGGLISNTRIIAELFPREIVGTAFGFSNAVTWLGSATYPFLISIFLSFGLPFSAGFITIILSLVGITIISKFSLETGNLDRA